MIYRIYWIKRKHMTNPYSEGYVGLTKFSIEERFKQHLSEPTNLHLKRALNKHRKEVEVSLLEEVKTLEEAKASEAKYRPSENIGWNLAAGGWVPCSRAGCAISEETRKKLAKSHMGQTPWNLGKSASEETKLKLSIARKKRIITDETKRKTSETNLRLGRKPPTLNGVDNGFYGKTHSEAAKQKMRDAWAKRKAMV